MGSAPHMGLAQCVRSQPYCHSLPHMARAGYCVRPISIGRTIPHAKWSTIPCRFHTDSVRFHEIVRTIAFGQRARTLVFQDGGMIAELHFFNLHNSLSFSPARFGVWRAMISMDSIRRIGIPYLETQRKEKWQKPSRRNRYRYGIVLRTEAMTDKRKQGGKNRASEKKPAVSLPNS